MYKKICETCRESSTFYTSHKVTAAKNEVALSYHRVRGLYFPAVVFVATIFVFNFKFSI